MGLRWRLSPGRASLGGWWLEDPRGQLVPARRHSHLTRWVERRSRSKLRQLSLLLGLLLLLLVVLLLLKLLQGGGVEGSPALQSLHVMGSLRGHWA